jgi:hypothetical protein
MTPQRSSFASRLESHFAGLRGVNSRYPNGEKDARRCPSQQGDAKVGVRLDGMQSFA